MRQDITTKSPVPTDDVAPQHAEIDRELEAWGRWSRSERKGSFRIGSAEGNYRSNWRSWHYPSAEEMMPRIPNPRMRVVDRAVLGLPVKHRKAVILHYVQLRTPPYICRKAVIPYVKFGEWMFDCRAMVLNLLRRAGV